MRTLKDFVWKKKNWGDRFDKADYQFKIRNGEVWFADDEKFSNARVRVISLSASVPCDASGNESAIS